MTAATYFTLLAAGRVLLGLLPVVAASATSRILGFPEAQDNPTARLMARLFGVRDIGLGALVLMNLLDPSGLRRALWLNLAMDLGDAVMISVPLVRRQGIDRAAGLCLLFALGGAVAWLLGLFVVAP
jgi:hypothetical protein